MALPVATASGTYYLRRKVPVTLRPALGFEYKRSLKTRDPGEAKRRFAEEWEKSEQMFALATAQLQGAQVLTEKDVQQLAARWFRARLDRLEQSGEFDSVLVPGDTWGNNGLDGGPEAQELLTVRQAIAQGEEWDWNEFALEHMTAALRDAGVPVPDASSEVHASLTRAFKVKFEVLSDIAKKRSAGDWASTAPVMEHGPLSFETKDPAQKGGMSLLALFESYAKEKRLNDGDGRDVQKTLSTYRASAERFIELCGDLSIEKISRAVVGDFRSKLAQMPVRGEGIRSMTAKQQIALADAKGLPRLSAPTIRNQLRALSAILGHGVRQGLLLENSVLASGLSKAAAKAASRGAAVNRKRKEYTKEELRAIFSSPIYSQDGWRPPRAEFGEAWYWLPLLLYYSGARREELAQLHVADVRNDAAGLKYLSILEIDDGSDGARTVKTGASRRRIPLHPDLISRGFMTYVEGLPAAGQLFPLLEANKTGYFGANFGKRWAVYLSDVVGLKTTVSPVHGFRHTFKTLCREAGIREDVQDAITGHAGANKVARDYGTMPLSRMAADLTKYPTIEQLGSVGITSPHA